MGQYDVRPCPCGSGKDSWWLVDARGIPCTRVCEACEDEKRNRYRPEIFEDSNYTCDEYVDDDY